MRRSRFITTIAIFIVAFILIAGIVLFRNPVYQPIVTPEESLTKAVSFLDTTTTRTPTVTSQILLLTVDLSNFVWPPTRTTTLTVMSTVTPHPTFTAPPTPTSFEQTNTSTPTPTSKPTPTPTQTDTPTPIPTTTDEPTQTDIFIPSPTNTPSQTPTESATPTRIPGSITGRITFQGTPVSGGLSLSLENNLSNEISRTIVSADGSYTFVNLPASEQGYNVVFAQEWNEQYGTEQVVSWAWIGPIPVGEGSNIQLPDFDISLLGFGQISPTADTFFPTNEINQVTPLIFEWSTYPGGSKYWVDLTQGNEQELVWQSRVTPSITMAFDGTLTDGTHISPGEYWWAVGTQGLIGEYPLTIYGYFLRFIVTP